MIIFKIYDNLYNTWLFIKYMIYLNMIYKINDLYNKWFIIYMIYILKDLRFSLIQMIIILFKTIKYFILH